jgi:pyridoxal phosphate enzyme (YggS family)
MTNIQQNLTTILNQIREYESRYHRTPGAVNLLAVSKGQSSARMKAALAAGQLAFGENYLQEALTKMQELAQSNIDMSSIEWHFIGKIQSNKTKNIATHFSWVHSVSEFNIAKRFSEQRPEHLPPLNICFEVNVSQETTKSGVRPDELFSLVKSCALLPRLRLRGLMAIPAPAPTVTEQRIAFQTLHELWQQCRDQGFLFDTLSMGMSEDFEAAIAEGATIVRIGTALFGHRET